jgi:hypothetical protein
MVIVCGCKCKCKLQSLEGSFVVVLECIFCAHRLVDALDS